MILDSQLSTSGSSKVGRVICSVRLRIKRQCFEKISWVSGSAAITPDESFLTLRCPSETKSSLAYSRSCTQSVPRQATFEKAH